MRIPTLKTPRLKLEPLSGQHSTGMFELWSCPEVCEFSGPVTDADGNAIQMPATTIRDSDRLIEFWIKAQDAGWGFRWAVLQGDKEAFVGHVGFNSLGECSEIAYHLHPNHWGQGLMSEAAHAALEWRRDFDGCREFEAFIEPENLPSIVLVERLGFQATENFSDGARRYRMTV